MLKSALKLTAGSSLLALFALVACGEEASHVGANENTDGTELAAGGSAGAPSSDVPSESAAGGQGGEQSEPELELEMPAEVLVRKGEEVSFEASVTIGEWSSASVTLVNGPPGVTLTKGESGLTITTGPDSMEGDVELTLQVDSEELSATQTLLLTIAGAPGTLDLTFGDGGKVALGGDGRELVFDAAGRFVALTNPAANLSQVSRVLWDGTLDTDFDEDGIVDIAFIDDAVFNQALEMTLLQNGDIAITGQSGDMPGGAKCLVRYDAAGQPTGLDGDGRVCLAADTWISTFGANSILLCGADAGKDGAAFKVTPNGKLDATFGGGAGKAVWPSADDDLATATLPVEGGFMMAVESNTKAAFSLVRFDENGEVVTSFGTAGSMTFNGHSLYAANVGLGGRIFLQSRNNGQSYVMVLDGTGEADFGFGTDGVIDLTPLGKFVLGAYPSDNLNEVWLYISDAPSKLGRVNAKGELDTSFGVDGYADVSSKGFGSVLALPRGRVATIGGDGTIYRFWR